MIYRLLADGVVVMHFACIVFILGGLGYIVLGRLQGGRRGRDLVFRRLHLAVFVFVGVWAVLGHYCPLTHVEYYLRSRGGGAEYAGSFIVHYLERLIYLQVDELWLRAGAGLLMALTVVLYRRYPPLKQR